MEIISRQRAMSVVDNKRSLRESERREAKLYEPDPNLSRQQQRLAERIAAKEREGAR